MRRFYTRRDFLKLTAASLIGLGNLAFRPFAPLAFALESEQLARVAAHAVDIRAQADDKSAVVSQRFRDDLLNVYAEVISPAGPAHNPLWYRVWGGYVHSARLQKVSHSLNPLAADIPAGGQLAEVTVPFTQSMRWVVKRKVWEPLYRLYFESHHWVTAVEPGPDGQPWYRLHDELTEMKYHVPAAHLRLVAPGEFAPLSPQVDPERKRIRVSIARQTLQAYEGDRLVLETKVSTGLGKGRGSETPLGDFNLLSKMPSKHMGNGGVTSDLEAYELPGVPWTSFFTSSGHAIHGTYWHQNFGAPMSSGCVNVPTAMAKWIFRWTTPVSEPGSWDQRGIGTRVEVTD